MVGRTVIRYDRPAIEHDGRPDHRVCGTGDGGSQPVIDAIECLASSPEHEIPVDRIPVRQIVGQ
jgi:hypothetical protein